MSKNNNYSEYIMQRLRHQHGWDEDNTEGDDILQSYSPEAVFIHMLEYEGIFGYASYILQWIEDIFKVRLRADYNHSQDPEEFLKGMSNIMEANRIEDNFIMFTKDDLDGRYLVFKEFNGSDTDPIVYKIK